MIIEEVREAGDDTALSEDDRSALHHAHATWLALGSKNAAAKLTNAKGPRFLKAEAAAQDTKHIETKRTEVTETLRPNPIISPLTVARDPLLIDSRVVAQAAFTTAGRTFYAAQEMFNRTLEIINAAGDLDQLSFRKEDIYPDAEFVATPLPKTVKRKADTTSAAPIIATPLPKTVKRKADSTDTTSAAKRPRIVATPPDSTPAPDTTSKRSRSKKEKAPAYD
ncbi:unnamed protein product [Zymoseptoria tritici ST99CH_1E4]|uniref:Uncharacterized protein n=1 Tax=Zymoseptoria tritici ST99CH_1E4 TaxID=1276532 RepID=A0A2H1FW80_ZYMTR|nr:unnamed protein product [Zymoseptoria tritici ST99CH_1E4]